MKNVAGKNANGIPEFQRIVFIIVYFGSVPWYFKFFNKSCTYNPDVDFLLITDMDVSEGLADNITIVKSSLPEISKRLTQKLGFEINIDRPYKLCDIKPSWGFIFSDLIEGYDFWGYCDIDLVFGNIRSLITADILKRHDVITIREGYLAGFFTLFRNNEKINTLFKRSNSYRKVFQEPIYHGFDECSHEFRALTNGKNILQVNSGIESISHVIKTAEQSDEISAYWRHLDCHPGKAVWDRGALFNAKNERVLLCHFIYFKALGFKYVPKWKSIPERFYLHPFYFTRHAPGSLAGRSLHLFLKTARFTKELFHISKHYTKWMLSYLFASRKINSRELQHSAELVGKYKQMKMVVSVLLNGDRLHLRMNNAQIPLFYKGAGKFVLGKCKMLEQINLEIVFHFDAKNKVISFQATGSDPKKYTFFKIS